LALCAVVTLSVASLDVLNTTWALGAKALQDSCDLLSEPT
jgi:hypothetical protein